MNYNHLYHAGNFADVFKHSVLCVLIESLQKKDKPCVYIDAHAGSGIYNLRDERAQKTQEASAGVLKLLEQSNVPSEMSPYLGIIQSYLSQGNQFYPGSPVIIRDLLRENDRMILNELHPDFVVELKKLFKREEQVSIHHRDAHEFLLAVLPPDIRRGLILLDPPYEKKDEYYRLAQTLARALTKFSTGIYVIWYPIVDQSDMKNMRKIRSVISGHPSLLVEMTLDKIHRTNRGLTGTGLLLVNPPWQCDLAIGRIADYLCKLYGRGDGAVFEIIS